MLKKVLFLSCIILLMTCHSGFAGSVRNLDARQASELIRQKQELFLLDVRTLQEFQQVRLANAKLIPIDQFLAREKELPAARPILVYCAVGSRSSQVAAYLAQKGYAEVYNLNGGIWAWELRGLPVFKGLP